jgi:hypothetical protein
MRRAQGLLADGQGPLEERLRLSILPLGAVEPGEVIEGCGHVGMYRA